MAVPFSIELGLIEAPLTQDYTPHRQGATPPILETTRHLDLTCSPGQDENLLAIAPLTETNRKLLGLGFYEPVQETCELTFGLCGVPPRSQF